MKSYEQTHKEITEEIKSVIIADIEQYKGSTLESYFQDAFNSDYYIIGTYKAKEWLTEKDVFNCIDIVQEWEKEVFGELLSDLSNPEHLVNLVVYAIADALIHTMCNDLSIDYTEELTEEHIQSILEYL